MKVGDLVTNNHTGDLAVVVKEGTGLNETLYLIHHFELNHQCWLGENEVEVIDECR